MSGSDTKWNSSSSSLENPASIFEEHELQPLISKSPRPRRCNSDEPPPCSPQDGVLTRRCRSLNDTEKEPIITSRYDIESLSVTDGKEKQRKLNTQLLEAVRWSDYPEAKKLLDAGADPNATCQSDSVSACHLAALNNDNILSLLLERGAKRDRTTDFRGTTPLCFAVWAGNLTNMGLVLGLPQELQKKLDYHKIMTEEIEEELIKLRPVLRDLVNIQSTQDNEVPEDWLDNCTTIHRTWFNSLPNTGESPLHSASSMPRAHALRFLLAAGADPSIRSSHCEETPLDVAGLTVVYYKVRGHIYESEFKEVVQILLSKEYNDKEERKNNVNQKHGSNLDSVLCTAVQLEDVDSVVMLLKAGANPKTPLNGQVSLHIAVELNNIEIAKAIIKFDKTTIHHVNESGYTPLHTASFHGSTDAITLLLREGADLSAYTKGSVSPLVFDYTSETSIQQIMDHVEKPTEFLEEIFDSCLELSSKEVTIDYGILIPNTNQETDEIMDMSVIKALLNTGNRFDQRRLLLHPLIESLICLKWQAILPFYYTMTILYGLFTISLTCYILTVYNYKDNNTDVPTWLNAILISVVYVFLTLSAPLEILFYLNMSIRYLVLQGEFWFKYTSLVLGMILPPFITNSPTESGLPRHAATMALLLSWTEMTLLMSRIFEWGYYVQMFNKVAYKVLKILLTFVCLLIGFTLCFMMQFHTKTQFENFWAALVKTIVMMTSEFEYDDLVTNSKDDVSRNVSANNESWSIAKNGSGIQQNIESEEVDNSLIMIRFIFLVFLILAAIVLMNLMIGAAVDDLNGLKLWGNIMRLEKQAEFLAALETNKVLMKIMPKIIKRKLFLSLLPIQITLKYPSNYWNAMPSHIRKAIINIAHSNRMKISNVEIDVEHLQKDRIIQNLESVPRDYVIVDRDYLRQFEFSLIQVKDRIHRYEINLHRTTRHGFLEKDPKDQVCKNLSSSRPPPLLPIKLKIRTEDQASVPGNYVIVKRDYLSKLNLCLIKLRKIVDTMDGETDFFLKKYHIPRDREHEKLSSPPSPLILSKKQKVQLYKENLQKDLIGIESELDNYEIVEKDYLRKLNFPLTQIKKRIEVLESEAEEIQVPAQMDCHLSSLSSFSISSSERGVDEDCGVEVRRSKCIII